MSMTGEGYAIYVNGKLLAESKDGVPNRAGGQPRGGHVYADLRDEFKGGKVTLAATSFLQFSKKAPSSRRAATSRSGWKNRNSRRWANKRRNLTTTANAMKQTTTIFSHAASLRGNMTDISTV